MPDWISKEAHPTYGRSFQRPLGPTELAFYFGSCLKGIGDSLHHAEVRLLDASGDAHLFSEINIMKVWVSTKRRYPLAGATIQIVSGGGDDDVPVPCFVVREHDLSTLRPHEIVVGQVACAEEVSQRMAAMWDGPRPLSDDLLSRLYVFRETSRERIGILHLITLIAHCVTDGTADRTFMRCLLDTLARGGESKLAQVPLEERLQMVVPSENLVPVHLRSLSPARRRWRRAIGFVIFQLRMARRPGGGQTLPCHRTRATPRTPARPGFASTLLSPVQTTNVLANCRRHEITFGSAYLVLAQVAMTRLLYRRYLRGVISDDEWEYRKKQPHRTCGPLNLRPYLDRTWYERGGGGEFMVSVNIFFYQLPFMTLGRTKPHEYHKESLLDGAPPFSDLLTFDRFLHRAGLVKKQAKALFDHPLFFEILHATSMRSVRRGLQSMNRPKTPYDINAQENPEEEEEVLAAMDIPVVYAHGGSSLGNVDTIFPTEYPLPPMHALSPLSPAPHSTRAGYVTPPPVVEVITTPKIVVESAMTQLYTGPAELYLGALTAGGRLNMHCFYDRNVYEEGVTKEWLDELRGAVLWYLGQTHRSHRAPSQ